MSFLAGLAAMARFARQDRRMRSLTLAQTARFSDPRSPASRTQRRLRIPVRHLLVQRVAAGTTGVLCLLGATVPLQAEAARWLPGLRPPGLWPSELHR